MDLLVDGLAAKSASEYASRIGFVLFLMKIMPFSGCLAIQRRMRRAATRYSDNGLAKKRARWFTAKAMSGRVLFARYWSPPMIELYSQYVSFEY